MRAAIVVAVLPAALCAAAAPSRDFYRNGTSLPSLGPRPYVSAIVMSYNHKGNIAKIAELLHAEPGVGEIVVAEDGSTDGSPEAWRAHLAPRDKLVESADVHEIRAYNGGARAATGAVYCFLQDDDLPDDAGWAQEVLALFEAFRGARLGVVSGLAAEVCQVELGEVQVDHPAAMKNAKVIGAVPGLGRDGTYALICLATFGFFLLMTMPKIGFATLLQHMATASDAPGRVFGFTAAFIMVVDSLVVAGLSLCAPSAAMKLSTFLWIAGGSVAAIGLFEGACGPRLVLGAKGDGPRPSLGADALGGDTLDTARPLINA